MLILIEGANCVGKSRFLKNIKDELEKNDLKIKTIHSPTHCKFFTHINKHKSKINNKKYKLFHEILSFIISHNYVENDYIKYKNDYDIIFLDRHVFFSGIIYQCFSKIYECDMVFTVKDAVSLLSSFSRVFDMVRLDMCFLLCEYRENLEKNLQEIQKKNKNNHLDIKKLMFLQECYIEFFKNCFYGIFECQSSQILISSKIDIKETSINIKTLYYNIKNIKTL